MSRDPSPALYLYQIEREHGVHRERGLVGKRVLIVHDDRRNGERSRSRRGNKRNAFARLNRFRAAAQRFELNSGAVEGKVLLYPRRRLQLQIEQVKMQIEAAKIVIVLQGDRNPESGVLQKKIC